MAKILAIGEKFPEFKLDACVSIEKGNEFKTISSADSKGKWTVVFFWPFDFTFVCPTEIAGFNDALPKFEERDAVLYGCSTDSKFVHLAWRKDHDDLRNLGFPMLADHKKELSSALGILHDEAQAPLRATYIIDPDGIIQWVSVNGLNVGRNVDEVLRTLDGLQTDELCPCNWTKGQAVLSV